MVSTNAARCYISGLSTVELERKCDLYKSRSVSASTMKARVGQWECYLRFCHKYSFSPYPCTPHRAALYASHLATYMVYTSICNYLHAVIFYHKLHGHPPPVLRDSELRMTLQGIRRAESRVKNVKSPIFPQHLRAMGGVVESKLDLVVFVASLFLFRCLLRVSHVIASPHEVRWSDLQFHSWGVAVTVRLSKTNQFGENIQVIPVCDARRSLLSLSYWLKRFLASSKCDTVFVFRQYGFVLTCGSFSSKLKELASRAGVNVPNLGSHSLRRGGATWLSSVGVPLEAIKDRGDWRSSCVEKYVREQWDVKLLRDQRVASMLSS